MDRNTRDVSSDSKAMLLFFSCSEFSVRVYNTSDVQGKHLRSINRKYKPKWGVRFFTVNKIHLKHFVLLLLCVCIYNWFIIGQYHSGNNMSSKSEAAGEILFFESEKCHEIRPLKTEMLTVSTFNAFVHVHDESKHYLSHQSAQRRYRFTQFI